MGFEIDSFAVAAQDRCLRGVGIVRFDGAVGASILAVGVRDLRIFGKCRVGSYFRPGRRG